MTLQLSSTAFKEGAPIPKQFTGDGADTSPPLQWAGIPEGSKSFALICDDPDAPRAEPWVHWVIYAIPTSAPGLAEGVPGDARLRFPAGAVQGKNDFGRSGYGGPAPPRGHGTHHYHFRLYALSKPLGLEPGATKKQVLAAMKGKVLEEACLTGIYSR